MADVILFGVPQSPFVSKVIRALALKGKSYDLVEPKGPGDFKAWNPQTRKMPVIEIDGKRIYDSTRILKELDRHWPEPPLYASDKLTAARQRLLEDWSDESLYWHVMALRWDDQHTPATLDQITGDLPLPGPAKPIVRAIIKRQLGGTPKAQGLGRLKQEELLAAISERLDDLDALLGDGPFFYGDQPSAADLAIYGMLGTAQEPGPTPELGQLVAQHPRLVEYFKRVEQATGG